MAHARVPFLLVPGPIDGLLEVVWEELFRWTEQLLRPRWQLRRYLLGNWLLLGVFEVGDRTQHRYLLPLPTALYGLGLALQKMDGLSRLFCRI